LTSATLQASFNRMPNLVATVVSGHTFTIDGRYDLKDAKILGRGSYGVVTTAYDSLKQRKLAIKRIRPFANDDWDARHTIREIRLMKVLGSHPNVRYRRDYCIELDSKIYKF
jgi:serine/threonine protein kinase